MRSSIEKKLILKEIKRTKWKKKKPLNNVKDASTVLTKLIDGNAVDEDGYGSFNTARSTYRGEFVWEFNYGTIDELYVPFRDREVIFERDIYREIEERNKRLLKRCQERNLFRLGEKISE